MSDNASSKPPSVRSRAIALRAIACCIFLAYSLPWAAIGGGERSGWILMTSPTGADHDGNSLLGYSFLHGAEPFMKEDIPHVAQIGAFCGCLDAFRNSEYRQDFRLYRALYSLLASLIAPIVGVIPSMLLVNWLAWALCAWVTWRLARAVCNELAGLLSVMLVGGGMGMTTHIGDYSPHLLSFATYYLGIWLIYSSRVYVERRPWKTHLWLGLYFAIACLTYNTGIMLVGVYLLSAAQRNRFSVAIGSAIGLSARPLWQAVLQLRLPIEDREAGYLRLSLDSWYGLLDHNWQYILKTIAHRVSECVFFFDSPLVVIAGLACCVLLRERFALRWFAWMAIAVPMLAALVFTPIASARGYLVYGGTVWLYVALAVTAARLFKSSHRNVRTITVVAIALVVTTHTTWSAAHQLHFLGPLKTYFLGWDHGTKYLLSPRTEVLSLTDHEPTPILFGGKVPLRDAGVHVANKIHRFRPEQVSFLHALVARGWFFLYFLLLAAAAARSTRERLGWCTAILAIYFVSAGLSATLFRSVPAFFKVDEGVLLRAGETLKYEVKLGPRFLASLRQRVLYGDRLIVFLRGPDEITPFRVHLFIGGHPWASFVEGKLGKYEPGVLAAAEVGRFSTNQRLTIEIVNSTDEDQFLFGWQRANLPERTCTIFPSSSARPTEDPRVSPVVELRLVAPNGRAKVIGF